MMGTPVISEATWNKVIGWLGNTVKELGKMLYEQAHQKVLKNLVGWPHMTGFT